MKPPLDGPPRVGFFSGDRPIQKPEALDALRRARDRPSHLGLTSIVDVYVDIVASLPHRAVGLSQARNTRAARRILVGAAHRVDLDRLQNPFGRVFVMSIDFYFRSVVVIHVPTYSHVRTRRSMINNGDDQRVFVFE